jgi:hypothetical protein
VIVLGAGMTPAEMTGELGPVPSGQPPIGGEPPLIKLLRDAPVARIVVVLDPAEVEFARLVRRSCPDVTIVSKTANGSVGDAFLAGYEALADADPLPTGSPTHQHGYVVYADTVANFPHGGDVILTADQSERRWTTVELDGVDLRIIEKNTIAPLPDAMVGMFHLADLNFFAECVRSASDRHKSAESKSSVPGVDEPDDCRRLVTARASDSSRAMNSSSDPLYVEPTTTLTRGNSGLDIFHDGLISYHKARPLRLEKAEFWLDVGHLDTYHDARRTALVTRWFNTVHVDAASPDILVKTGVDPVKLAEEAAWYTQLPPECRIYTPRLLEMREDGYSLEYIPGILVAEQYVFGRHDDAYWSRYLATLDRTVDVLHSGTCSWDAELAKVARERMWVTKTGDRLANVAACWPELSGAIRINGVDVPGLSQVQAELAGVVAASRLCVDRPITRIHGDLHGGNMLYEHRTNTLKMIDPRGSFGVAGGYGDPVYDLAKLAHGFIGRYDSIVFDCYEVAGGFGSYSLTFIEVGTGHAVLAQQFRSWLSERAGSDPYQVTMRDVDLGNALMFLSLAALHGDDSNRQLAFLLRGLQLWGEAVTTPPPAK